MPRITRTDLPPGYRYIPHFLSESEERELLCHLQSIVFAEVRLHGVVAKQRVAHLGWIYGYESWKIAPGPPMPDRLQPLRERVVTLIDVTPTVLEQALVTCYPAGAGIGWHCDAPMFGPAIVGVSLLGSCRLRFQQRPDLKREVFEAPLEPRSAHILSGAARDSWQHSIPATKEPRFSVTFRTVKHTGSAPSAVSQ